MPTEHYVIVGNGPAANQAALTLRQETPEARVTMIGRERVGYYRPHLLPGFVAGHVREADLYVQPLSFYKEQGIKLRLGQEVQCVDFDARHLTLEHKERVPFDGLILAVGGRPRIPEPLQVYENQLLTLKTLKQAKAWRDKLKHVESVLVVGGDLPSLSFTRALLDLGKQVRFVLHGECFWPLRLGPTVREHVVDRLRDKGVEVLDCKQLKSLARISEHQVEVETDTGNLKAGAVGAFFGMVPDVKFLVGSGLHIERGILVDEYLKTPFEGVYAAGDCAQVFHPDLHDYWVSIGYGNAKKLGQVAARNLVGGRVRAKAAPQSVLRVEGITVNTSWWTEF